jgi:N6-L-threonylcarbamoyladenine synthase
MGQLVLGIETSCDETAAAVVEDGTLIRSNVVHSQVSLHRQFRGVVPEVASRSHTRTILPVVEQALADADVAPGQLHGVAVTNRPGMIGCLLVGLAAAKALSWIEGIPILGVDHIQAHLHAAFMTDPDLELPCLGLVASGGHTALYLLSAPGAAERIGSTRDDAAGEALDKGAALLGLAYPGGPAIEAAAEHGDPSTVRFPRSMLAPDSLDFSFSGIKTALLYHLRGSSLDRPLPDLSEACCSDLAAAYQAAVLDVLVAKLRRAARAHQPASVAIGGGVARNRSLRRAIAEDSELGNLHQVFPPQDLCSDNGAMVAGLGSWMLRHGLVADMSLDAAATSRGNR